MTTNDFAAGSEKDDQRVSIPTVETVLRTCLNFEVIRSDPGSCENHAGTGIGNERAE